MTSQSIRILYIAPLYYRPSLPHFSDRFRCLPERYSGEILCTTTSEYEGQRFGNFSLHTFQAANQLPPAHSLILAMVRKGLELHRQAPFDLILAYDPLSLGIVGMILKFLTGAKLITEVNGHVLTAGFIGRRGLKSWIKKRIVRETVRFNLMVSNAVKFVSQDLCRAMKVFAGVNAGIFCFSDFVPTAHFFQPTRDDHYILFVGFPFRLKGVDLLIQAFKKLHHDFPGYRLIIMGFNNVDLDDYKRIAEDAPIEFHQPVFNDAMPDYFSKCSFLVLPSRSEGLPRVLIEAMAAGKSCVGSRIGGIPEVIDDGVTGLLFENENIAELEAKMRILLGDKALRQRMGDAGRQRVRELFSEEVYTDHFVKMIDSVMNGEKEESRIKSKEDNSRLSGCSQDSVL